MDDYCRLNQRIIGNGDLDALTTKLYTVVDLDSFLSNNIHLFKNNTFHTHLVHYKHKKQFSIKEIINEAYFSGPYGYQVFRGIRLPSRNKVVQIGLILGLSPMETNNLLQLAGRHELYAVNPRDKIIMDGMDQGQSLDQVESLLIQQGHPTLDD